MENELYIKQIYVTGEIPESDYIGKLSVVRHLKKEPIDFSSPVTFFVGENGVGKSTLIEGIAVAYGFNAEGGSRNFSFATRASHSSLSEHLRVVKSFRRPRDGFFLRAESYYNVASNIEEMDKEPAPAPPIINSYGGVSLHEQSHGESFLALVKHRFGGEGVYILDEPEAALSPMRLLTLMCYIKELTDKGSQFIISTHSPSLMAFPGAEVFEITDSAIKSVPYKDTEHYSVTRRFLNDPESILDVMLREDENKIV